MLLDCRVLLRFVRLIAILLTQVFQRFHESAYQSAYLGPAMPKGRISKRSVDALVCPSGKDRVFLWDAALAGFGAAAFPTGKKVYVCQYRQGAARVASPLGDMAA